jgi:hypothetical protein
MFNVHPHYIGVIMQEKYEAPERLSTVDLNDIVSDLVPPPAAIAEAPPKDKFGFFYNATMNPLGQAAIFSVGAAIRNQPVFKGAITALAGGAVIGAVVGLIGSQLGVKDKGNSLKLSFSSFLLEWALTLATMPLGAQIVPFEQELSMPTLIEDQLIGSAVLGSPVFVMLALLPCCLCACYAQLDEEEKARFKSKMYETLRAHFSTVDLVLTATEYPMADAAIVKVDANHTPASDNAHHLPIAHAV